MSDGGKGDKPRPFTVSKEEFADNMTRIFGNGAEERRLQKQKENAEFFARLAAETKARMENNTGTDKQEHQDILSTEDCLQNETGTDQV
jgi:hypothetical protein